MVSEAYCLSSAKKGCGESGGSEFGGQCMEEQREERKAGTRATSAKLNWEGEGIMRARSRNRETVT